jgi:hypothetical protein
VSAPTSDTYLVANAGGLGTIQGVRTVQRDAVQPIGRRPVLLAAVLAVLFGILGMHALNNHGAMASPAATGGGHQMSAMSAMAGAATDAAAVAAGEQGEHPIASFATAVPNTSGGDHGPVGMLMVCLAMLVAAAIALTVAVRTGQPLRWLDRPRWTRSRRRPQTLVRGTGPPPIWEFSVIRC